jgi:hypothetical protein
MSTLISMKALHLVIYRLQQGIFTKLPFAVVSTAVPEQRPPKQSGEEKEHHQAS